MARAADTWGARALKRLLGSEVRAKLVARACTQPDEPLVGRELGRELGLNSTGVSRELRNLRDIGLLRVGKTMGRVKPYHVNEDSPLLPGLRSIVQYAVGVVALLRDRLGDRDDIDAAFIYGSVAAGDDRPQSDIDVVVIGAIGARELSSVIRQVERTTRRAVNQVHYSRREFASRAGEPGGFLSRVLDGPKVFLRGDDDALRELAH